jgi:hypothetical protein
LDVQQIADQRRAISAFGVSLAPSATESTPEVVQHKVSVSLGIVGHDGWGTHDKTFPRSRDIMFGRSRREFESEPGSIPVGVIVETGTAWGVPTAVEPAVLF